MYSYTICDQYDRDIFKRQCKALERHIPNLKKTTDLEDVDGSQICIYEVNGKKIRIDNDFMVGAVYIDSEVDLLTYFPQKSTDK